MPRWFRGGSQVVSPLIRNKQWVVMYPPCFLLISVQSVRPLYFNFDKFTDFPEERGNCAASRFGNEEIALSSHNNSS